MNKRLLSFLLLLPFVPAFGQQLEEDDQQVVIDFIHAIKTKNVDALYIIYPFERQYPLPSIKNKKELIERFSEVFDDSLTSMIIHSDPNKDWSAMGWRGIMLHNGDVWLDYGDGRLMAVNYQSAFERKKRLELIEQDRAGLPDSLKHFMKPVMILETSKYRIRIDDMGDHYRYASWSIASKMSDQPEIVLNNGEAIAEGSGGNHRYEFKNGEYLYVCSIIILGENDSPPAEVTIYKNEKEIFSEAAEIKAN